MSSTEPAQLRVLISAESFLPSVNGVTNSVLRVVKHLDVRGHIVRIVAPAPGPSTIELESGTVVQVDRVRGLQVPMYDSLRFGVGATRGLRQSMATFRPDIIHLAAPVVLGSRVGSVARRLGIPSVALFQTDLSGFASDYGLSVVAKPIWKWLQRIHNQANLTLAPTDGMAGQLRSRSFERVDVWGRGVDHHQFNPERRSEPFRSSVGAGPSDVLVGYVGRLASEKRLDRLRPLLGLPGTSMVIVGDGPERSRLEEILPGAHFTGFLEGDELGKAMASLDVFVHTGEHETFCQTIQEAMACQLPVIAPASGGPVDLIDHGRDGYLYEPDDAMAMRRCVKTLLVDETLRCEMGLEGFRNVSDRSWEVVGDELIGRYCDVLDASVRKSVVAA